ncbi:hypothetical protein KI387_039264, partial [Taxus chinensis]
LGDSEEQLVKDEVFQMRIETLVPLWTQSTANTSVPRGRDIAEALRKFKQRILKS